MKTLLLSLAVAAFASAATPELAGNWQLNIAKSHLGQMSKPDRMTLTVAPKGSGYHSVQTTTDGMIGSSSIEGDWFLDGRYHPLGDSKVTQMSKWDGDTLYAEKKNGDGSVMEIIHLTVSADGKTATEKVSSVSHHGADNTTLVWERK